MWPGQVTTPLIQIGRIVNRHGVRGELRILPHNPNSTALDLLPEVVIETAAGASEIRRVLSARRHKRFVLVHLEDVGTANEAESLIGRTVSVRREDLPPPDAGEVYCHDLIGCAVCTEGGEDLGCVEEMLETGSNHVCVVRQGATEHLIPLVADVVVELSVEQRRIVIRPLPGLLDR
jgi:16S rRNA processing protein RimM